jgi:hypothetical protein
LTSRKYLIEESKDFATSVLSTSLVMIHNTERRCEDKVSETTSREHVLHPLLDILYKAIMMGT